MFGTIFSNSFNASSIFAVTIISISSTVISHSSSLFKFLTK
nr:MAG TPA: hypothetical protein [Siphoviridae sp. ctvzh6]